MPGRALKLLLLIGISLALVGCSEERYGSLYCPGPVDTLVVHARTEFQQVSIIGDESGMAGMESLYLGASGETKSEILLEYDFGSILGNHPDYPDSLFTTDSIRGIKLTMKRLNPYSAQYDTTNPASLYYQLHLLEEGFNPEDYVVPPGPRPSYAGTILNRDFHEPNYFSDPSLPFWEPDDVVDWINNGQKVGMAVTAGAESDSGLVGFASSELVHYQLLSSLSVGSAIGPTIVFEFEDRSIPNFLLPPVFDTSTFSQLDTIPPGLAHLQTGMRSYPVFTFDIPPLPAGSCSTVGYGFRLYSSEIDAIMDGQDAGLLNLEPSAYSGWENPVLASTIEESAISPSFYVRPDSTTPDGSTLFQARPSSRSAPVPPEEMHFMLGFGDNSVGIGGSYGSYSDIYFSRSAFHPPGESGELQPTLYIYYGIGGN